MTDEGVILDDDDLDAVGAAALIGISDQPHVVGVVGLRQVVDAHEVFPLLTRENLV